MDAETLFWGQTLSQLHPEWSFSLEPEVRISGLGVVKECAQVYVVDTFTGWSAGALATPEMMRRSHERALASGQDVGLLGWLAGQAVELAQAADKPPKSGSGGTSGAGQDVGVSVQAALKLAVAFVAARDESARVLRDGGQLAGVWLVLMYRFTLDGVCALVPRCVPMTMQQKGSMGALLTREQLRVWATQVVHTDLNDRQSPVFLVWQRDGMPQVCAQMMQA